LAIGYVKLIIIAEELLASYDDHLFHKASYDNHCLHSSPAVTYCQVY